MQVHCDKPRLTRRHARLGCSTSGTILPAHYDVQAALILCFGIMLLYRLGLPLPLAATLGPRTAPHHTAPHRSRRGSSREMLSNCRVHGAGGRQATDRVLVGRLPVSSPPFVAFPRRLVDGSQAPLMDAVPHTSHQNSSPLRTRASHPRLDQDAFESSWDCRRVPRAVSLGQCSVARCTVNPPGKLQPPAELF